MSEIQTLFFRLRFRFRNDLLFSSPWHCHITLRTHKMIIMSISSLCVSENNTSLDFTFTFQVFHMCQANGRSNSFLCPEGTVFDQRHLVCNWRSRVDCGEATSFYILNRDIYTWKKLQFYFVDFILFLSQGFFQMWWKPLILTNIS